MKRLFVITISLFLMVSCAKEVDENTLVDEGGVKFEPNAYEPYTGKVFDIYEEGQRKLKGYYKDGVKQGVWTYWEVNMPTPLILRHMKKRDSSGIIWLDDISKEKGTYRDGMKHGHWIGWFKSGNKMYEGTYERDREDGLWSWWWENGKKAYENTYKNGKMDGRQTKWHQNGQMWGDGFYKDGKPDGKWTKWYQNGQKTGEGTYKDDILIEWTSYNEDGSIKEFKDYGGE